MSTEILHKHSVHLWRSTLTIADTKSFIPDNTNNTIGNFGEYIYSKAYSQTKQTTEFIDRKHLTFLNNILLCQTSLRKHGQRLQYQLQ